MVIRSTSSNYKVSHISITVTSFLKRSAGKQLIWFIGFFLQAMAPISRVAAVVFSLMLLFFGLSAAWLDSLSEVEDNHAQHALASGLLIATQPRNYSVGFSLQSSYGATAIHFISSSGQLKTHTTVLYGAGLYREVIARLSLESSQGGMRCLTILARRTPGKTSDGICWVLWRTFRAFRSRS